MTKRKRLKFFKKKAHYYFAALNERLKKVVCILLIHSPEPLEDVIRSYKGK